MMKQNCGQCGYDGRALAGLLSVGLAAQAPSGTTGEGCGPHTRGDERILQGTLLNARAMGAVHSIEDGQDPTSEIIVARAEPVQAGRDDCVSPADGRIAVSAGRGSQEKAAADGHVHIRRKSSISIPHARSAPDGCAPHQYVPGGIQIRESAGYVTILTSPTTPTVVIPLDGRPQTRKGHQMFMGDSRAAGRQDTGRGCDEFHEETWFDSHGSIHSDTFTCRRKLDDGRARQDSNYEATIEDPSCVCETLEDRVRHQPQQDCRV